MSLVDGQLLSKSTSPEVVIPIETQDFSENKDKNHADKDARLFHEGSNASITHNPDTVAGGETSHPDGDTTAKMHEATAPIY